MPSLSENPGCLGFLFRLFGAQGSGHSVADASATAALPYRQRDDFLSAAEHSFYRVLVSAVGSNATVLAKVNLGDLFFVTQPGKNRGYHNMIDRKHVDFVLCDPQSMRSMLGIELDDKSHERPDRQERDQFVDRVFAAAGLPIMHVRARQSYSTAEISNELSALLGGAARVADNSGGALASSVAGRGAAAPPMQPTPQGSAVPPVPAATGSSVQCPRCGSTMVLRTASRGARQGETFYGCPHFPKCQGTLPASSQPTSA